MESALGEGMVALSYLRKEDRTWGRRSTSVLGGRLRLSHGWRLWWLVKRHLGGLGLLCSTSGQRERNTQH